MYSTESLVSTSKFLSYILRHHPESIGLHLDREGWADIEDLLSCAERNGRKISRDMINEIVTFNDKKRFALFPDGSKIRAVQGHSSSSVSISYSPMDPPEFLYHGTACRFLESILKTGLNSGNRHHVHLSADRKTAEIVGKRHGRPVILTIECGSMRRDGLNFFKADNGVWLTDHVPVKYIKQ